HANTPGQPPWTIVPVQPGGPAEKAGLALGDRIMRIDGKEPDGLIQFNDLIGKSADHEATLTIQRQREPVRVHLIAFEELIRQKTGLTLTDLNARDAQQLGLEPGKGRYVKADEKNSPRSEE